MSSWVYDQLKGNTHGPWWISFGYEHGPKCLHKPTFVILPTIIKPNMQNGLKKPRWAQWVEFIILANIYHSHRGQHDKAVTVRHHRKTREIKTPRVVPNREGFLRMSLHYGCNCSNIIPMHNEHIHVHEPSFILPKIVVSWTYQGLCFCEQSIERQFFLPWYILLWMMVNTFWGCSMERVHAIISITSIFFVALDISPTTLKTSICGWTFNMLENNSGKLIAFPTTSKIFTNLFSLPSV